MKLIFMVFLFLFSFSNGICFQSENILQKYPNTLSYHQIIFSKLKNYFDSLPLKSLVYQDKSGLRTYVVKNDLGIEINRIKAKIERKKISASELTERLIYTSEVGKSFSFLIKKTGSNIKESKDEDLLSLRFNPSEDESSYVIQSNEFNYEMSISRTSSLVTSYILAKGFDFNLKTDFYFNETSAELRYQYFFPNMPKPQTNLFVFYTFDESALNQEKVKYMLSSEGEVTPKKFFEALSQGASFYESISEAYLLKLNELGFPTLN
jgi:hypothetical protein